MYGVHGRLLQIDLASGEHETTIIPEAVHKAVIGGIGLASYLLLEFCPPLLDPLSPENPLIFATSPFVGTSITTASKLAVATKSPQTGLIGDSLSSSYLALALKRTGFDAIVLLGRAPTMSFLVIDDDQIELRPADHLLGLNAVDTATAIRSELGADFRVAAIGIAGERGVRFAAISNDGRLAGRTGSGAVMGAKGLKAIAVRGTMLPAVADPRRLTIAARQLAKRSLGPATAKYRELGTAANLAFFNRLGILPSHNFRAGAIPAADAISGETLRLEHEVDRNGCAACTIGCAHHYATRDAGPVTTSRLEYESLYALGPLCGITDPNTILRAAALCDEFGMDSISTGATIAWSMECADRAIDVGFPSDLLPRFGDAAALLRTIRAIAHRQGIGELLFAGSRHAAMVVGQGSDAWAMHVKGLELPGYDPRRLPTLALGLAVSTRGACHNRSSAYEADLSAAPPAEGNDAGVIAAIAAEDQASVLDSLTVCKFLRHAFEDLHAELASLLTLVTGCDTTPDDLRRAGERIANVKKLFNIRQGWTRSDDTLPPRLFDESLGSSLLERSSLSRQITAYYRLRGWDELGLIPDQKLIDLGLTDLVCTNGNS